MRYQQWFRLRVSNFSIVIHLLHTHKPLLWCMIKSVPSWFTANTSCENTWEFSRLSISERNMSYRTSMHAQILDAVYNLDTCRCYSNITSVANASEMRNQPLGLTVCFRKKHCYQATTYAWTIALMYESVPCWFTTNASSTNTSEIGLQLWFRMSASESSIAGIHKSVPCWMTTKTSFANTSEMIYQDWLRLRVSETSVIIGLPHTPKPLLDCINRYHIDLLQTRFPQILPKWEIRNDSKWTVSESSIIRNLSSYYTRMNHCISVWIGTMLIYYKRIFRIFSERRNTNYNNWVFLKPELLLSYYTHTRTIALVNKNTTINLYHTDLLQTRLPQILLKWYIRDDLVFQRAVLLLVTTSIVIGYNRHVLRKFYWNEKSGIVHIQFFRKQHCYRGTSLARTSALEYKLVPCGFTTNAPSSKTSEKPRLSVSISSIVTDLLHSHETLLQCRSRPATHELTTNTSEKWTHVCSWLSASERNMIIELLCTNLVCGVSLRNMVVLNSDHVFRKWEFMHNSDWVFFKAALLSSFPTRMNPCFRVIINRYHVDVLQTRTDLWCGL